MVVLGCLVRTFLSGYLDIIGIQKQDNAMSITETLDVWCKYFNCGFILIMRRLGFRVWVVYQTFYLGYAAIYDAFRKGECLRVVDVEPYHIAQCPMGILHIELVGTNRDIEGAGIEFSYVDPLF